MWQVRPDIGFSHEPGHRDDVGTAFSGNKARNVLGITDIARPDRDVQIFAQRVERSPGKRQPVFPAIESAGRELSTSDL